MLLWVGFIDVAGLYLYMRGFLLTRLALPERTTCADGACTLAPTHGRAIILIIDALRFDFLSPNPPHPASPYHHNVLTVARELTAAHPSHSLLFDSFADPPTTTSQRIKGITTGSLPTFIDMGSNFGSASVAEDCLISQMRYAGKKIAFMGDDTWNTIYMGMFPPEICFPYDSFDLEDIHTVDDGVIQHLFPLMHNNSAQWDFIIGHFPGVDHVAHRVGPDHPKMRAKLTQMDGVLRRVVDEMENDTLLVVLGDHGMDRRGNHGGDSMLETSAALWVYSKTPLLLSNNSIPLSLFPTRLFPGANVPHRYIQQIDLAPSLALLLGFPIPYSSLGTIIPELFSRGGQLGRAFKLNVAQVKQYLDAYRASSFGGELDNAWDDLQELWATVQDSEDDDTRWIAMEAYTRFALTTCRGVWARFNVWLLGMGLAVLAMGTVATFCLYAKLGDLKEDWIPWAARMRWPYACGVVAGSVLGSLAYHLMSIQMEGIHVLDFLIFGASFLSALAIIVTAPPIFRFRPTELPVPLILHTLVFTSSSFTIWEDRIITYLLISSIITPLLTGFSAPTLRLRNRILGFSALFAGCVRAIAASTICRDEQYPFCRVTFATPSEPPIIARVLAIPTALGVPWVIRRVLQTSKTDNGVAESVLAWLLPVALVQGSVHWIIEWLETAEVLDTEWHWVLRTSRTATGQGALGTVAVFCLRAWYKQPLYLSIGNTQLGVQDSVTREGSLTAQGTIWEFRNIFGSSYLILWCAGLAIFFSMTQLTGQLVLALAAIALVAHIQLVDSLREVRARDSASRSKAYKTSFRADARPTEPVRFSDISPLSLLALHVFHGTGHQSTFVSIQWKTAFVLTSTLHFWLSLTTLLMNTLGPQFLLAFAVPLVVLWNVKPSSQPSIMVHVMRSVTRAALGMMLSHSLLLLGSAASSAWHRRHALVWQIFAPRLMNAAATVIVVDLAILLGVGLGVSMIIRG
ncbi:alkaline phosphatase-like protein [Daedalea quercina L-15889]|uniref:Alkaline phosphatase-like protein n=1 Tax=Daedalea quercina L-15889 TaxID=1314783 RepID=A0A165N374_9APHY|nr:alkaline phosphatase-like protein [Daedalea quercina L-15889]